MNKTYQTGDIFIFKAPETDFLSRCIAVLTKSDTSHAAMIYSDNSIVEAVAFGVKENSFTEGTGDMVYVMRLKNNPDSAPLIKAAKHYIDLNTKYDFPALLILAGLLVYRRIKPTQKIMSLTDKILLTAALKADDFIQKKLLKNPERAMVCSQLVYQIYHDCGKDYHINIDFGNIWSDKSNSNFASEVCLADILADRNESNNFAAVPVTSNVAISNATIYNSVTSKNKAVSNNSELENLYKELLDELLDTYNIEFDAIPVSNSNLNSDSYNSVLSSAQIFIQKMEQIHAMLKTDLPVDALFITPGDFVYHASNLERVSKMYVSVNRD